MGPLLLLALILLLGIGVWAGLALTGSGLVGLWLAKDVPALKVLAFSAWSSLNAAELASLPLFILMGEILFRTKMSDYLFAGLAPLTSRIPGGLLHSNIVGCTLFAAACGSSAATTATVGRITLGELQARGYDRRLAVGSLCGAGTLGFLIPPSIILILYGVLAEISVLDLFIAGIVPGLLMALAFMIYLGFAAGRTAPQDRPPISWRRTAAGLAPVLLLIGMILSSLYLGFASPSEAAVLGVAGSLIAGIIDRSLTPAVLVSAMVSAIGTISMVGLILIGALFLSRVAGYMGIPQDLAQTVAALDLAPITLILCLILVYALLGMALDGLSVIVMTLPVVAPLVQQAGFDGIWFGIFLVILVEMAQITPPVGFNLFVVQSLTGERLAMVARSALPFFLIMAGMAVLLALVPDLATGLPSLLR